MADILESYPSSLLESVLRHRGLMKCAADARGCTPAQNAALAQLDDAAGLLRSLFASTRNSTIRSDDVANAALYLGKIYEAAHLIKHEIASALGMDIRSTDFTVSREIADEMFLSSLDVLRDRLDEEEEYAASPAGRAAYDAEYRSRVSREEAA